LTLISGTTEKEWKGTRPQEGACGLRARLPLSRMRERDTEVRFKKPSLSGEGKKVPNGLHTSWGYVIPPFLGFIVLLGLYISHEIIRRRDGQIRVESEVGKGTVMTIELPCKRRKG
jgi:hypothetical protein